MNPASPNQIHRHAQKQLLREGDGLVASTSTRPGETLDRLRREVTGLDGLHLMVSRLLQAGQTDSAGLWLRQGAGMMRPSRDKSKLQGEKKKKNAR